MYRLFFICMFLLLFLVFSQSTFSGEGHKAGRDWAERRGIDDPDDCRSRYLGRWGDDNINNSPSFTEGCMEYLRDQGITNDDDEIMNDDWGYDQEDEPEDEDE